MGALALTCEGGLPRAVRAAARPTSPSSRTATWTRSSAAVDRRRPRPSSSSRSRARPASSCRRPATSRRPADHPRRTARCCGSTRCRRASAAPAHWFGRTTPTDVVPDVVTLAKGLGGGIPIGACIGVGRRRRPARPGQPRHHLRRQPGRVRRRPRRARAPSSPRACSTTRPSSASSCRDAVSPHDPRVTEVRGARPADRPRPRREPRSRRASPRPRLRGGVHRQRPPPRTRIRLAPPLVLTEPRPTRSSPPGRPSSTRPARQRHGRRGRLA